MRPVSEQTVAAEPLVSVVVCAYNREKTLGATIESILGQVTEFPVEIVIGNDGSVDGTAAIAEAYRERYPAVVRVSHRPRNVGIQRNYYETNTECRGRYVAWLDSDDVWTDAEKLTLQVQAMEADPSIALVGHCVRWVTPDGEVKRERVPTLPAGRYGAADILRKNFLPSPSVLFRNGLMRELKPWYFDAAPLTDWPVYLLAAQKGAIVLLDRVMADYHLSPNGAFWGKGDLFWFRLDIAFYDFVRRDLPLSLKRLARSEQGKRYERLAYHLRKNGDFAGSRRAGWKALRVPVWHDNVPGKVKGLIAAAVREVQWRLKGRRPDPAQGS